MSDLDEKIKIIKAYQDLRMYMPYGYGDYPSTLLTTCEILEVFEWDWGHQTQYTDFRIRKGYYITNNGSGHKSNPDEWYVEWDNGNVGAYQFVNDNFEYRLVQSEFQEFKDKLMSYNPVNYDPHNCHIIYNVENGKKVLEDYGQICKETREKMNAKIKQAQLEKAKMEYERLLLETNGGGA